MVSAIDSEGLDTIFNRNVNKFFKKIKIDVINMQRHGNMMIFLCRMQDNVHYSFFEIEESEKSKSVNPVLIQKMRIYPLRWKLFADETHIRLVFVTDNGKKGGFSLGLVLHMVVKSLKNEKGNRLNDWKGTYSKHTLTAMKLQKFNMSNAKIFKIQI